jgi:hypothetical protein
MYGGMSDYEECPDGVEPPVFHVTEALRIRRQSRGKVRRIPVMAAIDPATLDALDVVTQQRRATRSAIIGEILADWASRQGKSPIGVEGKP